MRAFAIENNAKKICFHSLSLSLVTQTEFVIFSFVIQSFRNIHTQTTLQDKFIFVNLYAFILKGSLESLFFLSFFYILFWFFLSSRLYLYSIAPTGTWYMSVINLATNAIHVWMKKKKELIQHPQMALAISIQHILRCIQFYSFFLLLIPSFSSPFIICM